MVALSTIHNGENARILKIDSGPRVRHQLQYLGLMEGDSLRMIQNSRGYLIVAKGTLRLGLGRGTGHKIFVERIGGKK